MPTDLDHDVTRPSEQQYPVSELVHTYLQQAGGKFFGLRDARREGPEAASAQDLWDYLGDFA
jgi:hypothetical protein